MSRRCSIIKKSPMSGNKVSHAKNKSRRRFMINLQNFTFVSDVLKANLYLKLANSSLRTIEKNGGIDSYLLQAKNSHLTAEARKIKRILQKKNK